MSAIRSIRKLLGMTQSELAEGLGLSQGNVSFLEQGQTVMPGTAAKLIELAAAKGLALSFDHVYGAAELPAPPEPAKV